MNRHRRRRRSRRRLDGDPRKAAAGAGVVVADQQRGVPCVHWAVVVHGQPRHLCHDEVQLFHGPVHAQLVVVVEEDAAMAGIDGAPAGHERVGQAREGGGKWDEALLNSLSPKFLDAAEE
jgi:hypothetical protein